MSKAGVLSALKPAAVWRHFEALSAVPRASGDEGRAVAFIEAFGRKLVLDVRTDAKGNAVIRKPATPGMESRATVALQSHLDMVQQQDQGRGFDFATQGIELVVDGDWVRADGTTLGADNGMGVALAMAVLSATDLKHPAIEALFTVDEEVGMSGAEAITNDQLSAPFMINLDMESDTDLTIGCAGAVDIVAEWTAPMAALPKGAQIYDITLSGSPGGHSGLDIHLGRMNAIKTLVNCLQHCGQNDGLSLIHFDGGEVVNAIPTRATARIAMTDVDAAHVPETLASYAEGLRKTYPDAPDLALTVAQCDKMPKTCFSTDTTDEFLSGLDKAPSGVISMSVDVDGLVETSNNLSVARAAEGALSVTCLARTCVEAHKPNVIQSIQNAFTAADLRTENDAPGWEPRADNALLTIMSTAYRATTGEDPGVIAIHAGLETGILSNTFPQTLMVSYGPNIKGAHSPDERVEIASVAKVWDILTATLARIPEASART